jgi:hypothetical protein
MRCTRAVTFRRASCWIAGIAAAAVVIAGCGSRPARSPSKSSAGLTAHAPLVNVAAFAGHGELAFTSRGTLWVLDGMTGSLRQVVTPGMTPFDPVFSPDARWLAFSATSTNPSRQASTVWLARGDASAARHAPSGGLIGWHPVSDVLAVQSGDAIRLIEPFARAWTLTRSAGIWGAVWSPDGRYLAVSTRIWPSATTLAVYPVAGGRPLVWLQLNARRGVLNGMNEVIIDPAGWWPRWGIGFWVFGDGMVHNNDQTPLNVLPGPGTRPRLLGYTLSDNSAPAAAAAPNGWLAIVNNPNLRDIGRIIWEDKRVEACSPVTGTCTAVPSPPSAVTLDPPWSPAGPQLAYVQAPYRASPGFPQAVAVAWYGAHRLWLYDPPSRSVRELDARASRPGPLTAGACCMWPGTPSGYCPSSAGNQSGSLGRCTRRATGRFTTGRSAGSANSRGGPEPPRRSRPTCGRPAPATRCLPWGTRLPLQRVSAAASSSGGQFHRILPRPGRAPAVHARQRRGGAAGRDTQARAGLHRGTAAHRPDTLAGHCQRLAIQRQRPRFYPGPGQAHPLLRATGVLPCIRRPAGLHQAHLGKLRYPPCPQHLDDRRRAAWQSRASSRVPFPQPPRAGPALLRPVRAVRLAAELAMENGAANRSGSRHVTGLNLSYARIAAAMSGQQQRGRQAHCGSSSGHSVCRDALPVKPKTPGSRLIRRLSGRPAVRGRRLADRVVPDGPSSRAGLPGRWARGTPRSESRGQLKGMGMVPGTTGETSRSPWQGAILAVARSDVTSSGGMITRVAAAGQACW